LKSEVIKAQGWVRKVELWWRDDRLEVRRKYEVEVGEWKAENPTKLIARAGAFD
jgi:hypothetical protein